MIDLKLYKRPLAALTVTGDKVRVTPGILSKFSNALAETGVNVYAATTGEYSVSFFVDEEKHAEAKKKMQDVVQKESAFISVNLLKNIGMVTVTGRELIDTPGMLLRVIEPVSKKKINILSVAHSFDSVMLMVDWDDARKAYEAIEEQFVKGL